MEKPAAGECVGHKQKITASLTELYPCLEDSVQGENTPWPDWILSTTTYPSLIRHATIM